MKIVTFTAVLIMLSATVVYAQTDSGYDRGDRHAGHHRSDPVARLTEKLNLSEDQAIEAAVILESSHAQHRAVQESVREEHCAIRENTMDELAYVLSDEQ